MIQKFINTWRLRLFLATRTFGYTKDYIEQVYKIYLNHNKIIHFRDGYPVYSLSTPAVFSKPAANFFARTVFRTIQNKNIPSLLSFAVNDACNAVCEHCSFFEGVDDKSKTIMDQTQCIDLIRQAQDLGVSMINFVGGEPLLRDDLTQIIRAVDKTQSATSLFTNGLLLEKQAESLRRAGLDGVYISLDSARPQVHDKFRGRLGLFEAAITGIKKAKKTGMSTGISCCITPESYRRGEFDDIVELAKTTGVHEVLVFDAMPTGRYKHRKDLMGNDNWIEDMIEASKKYNQNSSYPGVLIYAYATSHRSVGCSCGTSYLYVSPYGDVMSCDFNHKIFGSILEEPLYKVWDTMTSKAEFARAKWGGCKIKDDKFRISGAVAADSGTCGC